MKIDFRYEYRIVKKRRFSNEEVFFIAETRAWWRPWWKTLVGYNLFELSEFSKYEFHLPMEEYPTEKEAEAMANQYALNGRMAFVKNLIVQDIKYLGKLP